MSVDYLMAYMPKSKNKGKSKSKNKSNSKGKKIVFIVGTL